MSVAAQNLVSNSGSRLCFYPINFHGHPLKNPAFIASRHRRNHLHFEVVGHKASLRRLESLNTGRCRLRVFESEGTVHRDGLHKHNFDAFLSVAEVLCLVPSAALSIGIAVNWTFSSSQKQFMEALLNRVFAWQFVMLVGAVAIGALIRKRQWGRICRDSFKSGGTDFNLIERIEKLEEDLRSSAAIIRVLSRQLEKLGIRFRVTRKALKEPITEAAALAQKNSEATQALAEQEDILEKELGEIQKVLLAMQEQQQKQLELIVAIGKAGKLRESNREVVVEEETIKPCNPVLEETKQVEILTGVGHIGTDNDRA